MSKLLLPVIVANDFSFYPFTHAVDEKVDFSLNHAVFTFSQNILLSNFLTQLFKIYISTLC